MDISINTFKELFDYCISENKNIHAVSTMYMSQNSDISEDEVRGFAQKSLYAMREAISSGMASKELSVSGMCGFNCDKVQNYYRNSHSMFGTLFEKIIEYSLATSEENVRMGKIVACPTAGSCGILPSTLCAVSEMYNISEKEQINALITAGEIGRIVALKMPLAGAVAGCQAECGVASAMSAGAVCQLRGGSVAQIINAASLALKNIMGLTCDPVAGLVEVPCVKRNPFMAVYSITAAELALAGIKSVIPPDEIVDALAQVGALMSPTLKESSEAGLATTKTAMEIKSNLYK